MHVACQCAVLLVQLIAAQAQALSFGFDHSSLAGRVDARSSLLLIYLLGQLSGFC